MARNQETVLCEPGDWTQLNNTSLYGGSITFQCLSGILHVRYTATDTKPDSSLNGIEYVRGTGALKQNLTDLTYAATPAYVWGKGIGSAAKVLVDHA